MYWPPIPTTIARTTEVVTSGEALTPRGEQARDHLARARERVGAEEDPREADDMEREDAPEPHLRAP